MDKDKESTNNWSSSAEPGIRAMGQAPAHEAPEETLSDQFLIPPTAHTSHLGLFLKGNTIHGKAGGVQSSERSLQAMNRGLELSLTILPGLLTLLPAGLLDQHLHHYLLCFKEVREGGK